MFVFPSAVETAQAHLEEKSIIGIYGRFQGDETYGKQIIVDTVMPQGEIAPTEETDASHYGDEQAKPGGGVGTD